jgi:putative MATE family efflux protein
MKNLTEGNISRHLFALAVPLAISMLFQNLYYLVDLYFVARLGDAAIAGVSAAGNVQFLIMALTQVLGVGTMALIAHAVGRKDRADAQLVFNQSLILAALLGALTLIGGYSGVKHYVAMLAADPAASAAGSAYLSYFLPGLALQFALVAMGSALRGSGNVKPTMMVQVATVVMNIVLAPILIAGWGTGRPMGVAGAGLASTLAIAVGVVAMARYFVRSERYVVVEAKALRPQLAAWRRILAIGLPSGGEFALMFVYFGVIYWTIGQFGAAAQAGFGIGSRVMQAVFLPAMALAFATAPLAGQNFGAGDFERVRATFRSAALWGSALMIVLTLLCQLSPALLVRPFSSEPQVVAVAVEFLRFVSWNFVASGLVFSCSGMFQALGKTVPALLSSASRLLTFALPALWLASRPGFELQQLWILSVISVTLQALSSWWLLRRSLGRLG